MKLIKSDYSIIEQPPGLSGIYEQIELAGRTCYKSEDKITEDSAKGFVDRMIKSGHGAMLEHGTVYLKTPPSITHYNNNKYSIVTTECSDLDGINRYITTNLRVLVENGWLEDLKYLCEPTKYHEKRITVHFTTQIAISREFNRHRVNSMAEQSTRYCNYSKKKFENGIEINIPSWIEEDKLKNVKFKPDYLYEKCPTELQPILGNEYKGELSQVLYELETSNWNAIDWWLWANACADLAYSKLIELGWLPQQARTILPLDTNTELIHTAFISDWENFFKLRDDKQHAHPDAYALAKPLHEEFINKGYIK